MTLRVIRNHILFQVSPCWNGIINMISCHALPHLLSVCISVIKITYREASKISVSIATINLHSTMMNQLVTKAKKDQSKVDSNGSANCIAKQCMNMPTSNPNVVGDINWCRLVDGNNYQNSLGQMAFMAQTLQVISFRVVRSFWRFLRYGEGEVKLRQGELSLPYYSILHVLTKGCTLMETKVERALTSPSSHWWGLSTMLYCHGHSNRQWLEADASFTSPAPYFRNFPNEHAAVRRHLQLRSVPSLFVCKVWWPLKTTRNAILL